RLSADQELLGRRIHDHFPAADADRFLGYVRQAIATGRAIEGVECALRLGRLDDAVQDLESALAIARRRRRQRWEFAQAMLAIHLLNHERSEAADRENREVHLHEHMRWHPDFARQVVRRAEGAGWVDHIADDRLQLTAQGRARALEMIGS
ncbi:MAG: hypothetical protein KY464_13950, partial [Gemmatimonadetes bacterium]|nr:hypothetical protein [Gemmatimonadota bacterium]